MATENPLFLPGSARWSVRFCRGPLPVAIAWTKKPNMENIASLPFLISFTCTTTQCCSEPEHTRAMMLIKLISCESCQCCSLVHAWHARMRTHTHTVDKLVLSSRHEGNMRRSLADFFQNNRQCPAQDFIHMQAVKLVDICSECHMNIF